MIKFRSLFSRMTATNLAIIMIALLLLTFMLTLGVRSYVIDDSVSGLKKTSAIINELYTDVYEQSDSSATLKQSLSMLAAYEGMGIRVYDKYDLLYISIAGNDELLGNNEKSANRNESELLERDISEFGWTSSNDSNIYSTPVLSVRFPLKSGDEIKGSVVIHKRLTSYEKSMRVIYKRLLFCFAVSVLITIAITYFSYRRTIRTVASINNAAGAFARGDFKNRVEVPGIDEISTVAASYNNMADELEKYESTRQSFVANVSHELRSPLTSIQGFVQGMLDGTIEDKDKPQYLEIVLSETKRMSLLIQDLLDLAKIESGQFPLDMTRFNITEELRRTLIGFLTKIEEKNIEVTADIPEEAKFVLADKRRIAQVLTNLLDNAVKFCEKNGSLKIWTYEADGRIHINISNSGAYIPEEDLPYVFDRFFKVDKSHNKKTQGTGIGLSIVKNIVIQHGEKIWVNSRKGTGTVFTFTLRLAGEVQQKKGKVKIVGA